MVSPEFADVPGIRAPEFAEFVRLFSLRDSTLDNFRVPSKKGAIQLNNELDSIMRLYCKLNHEKPKDTR